MNGKIVSLPVHLQAPPLVRFILFEDRFELLDKKKDSVLPTHNSSEELASEFNTYFKEKISNIRKSFPVNENGHHNTTTSTFSGVPLNVFKPTTEDEIKTITFCCLFLLDGGILWTGWCV